MKLKKRRRGGPRNIPGAGPVVNVNVLQLKDRQGDYRDDSVENLLASFIRDPRGGEAWFELRIAAAKRMAKIPAAGERWYG